MIKLKALILLGALESTIAAANVPAATDHNEPNGLTALTEQVKQIRRSVQRTRIAALPGDFTSIEKTALEKRILQLSTMSVPSPRSLQQIALPAEPVTIEPNIVAPPQSNTPTDPFDDQTLQSLTILAKDPNGVAEPLALAQTLYDAGHAKEAVAFYEIALSRPTSLGRTLTKDDKAWILLQLASCHRDDINAALTALNKLLDDYPKSTWAPCAAAKRDILRWYQKDKPQSLLETKKR